MTVTLLGQTLDGRYRLDAPLGAGAMGEVYRGMQVSLMRPVAIKILPRRLMMHNDVVQRFEREAQLLSRLKHPGIVSVIDFGWAHGRPYLVMELVEGKSLEQELGDDGKMPPGHVTRVMINLCEALDHAHAMGVLHRDLKPSNILVEDARVRVVDFGVARALEHGNANITGEGMVLGTPKYCSPEQAMGLSLDGRSDLYALGVVAWRMLVGRVPFDGEGPAAIFSKHVLEVPPPLAEVAGLRGQWAGLAAIVDRLLAKSPGDRYPGALEAGRALEAVLGTPDPPRKTLSVPPMPPMEGARGLAQLDTSRPGQEAGGPAPTAIVSRLRGDSVNAARLGDRAAVDAASPGPRGVGASAPDDDAHTRMDPGAAPSPADDAHATASPTSAGAAPSASDDTRASPPTAAQPASPTARSAHEPDTAPLPDGRSNGAGARPAPLDRDTDRDLIGPGGAALAATHIPAREADDELRDTMLDHIARPYLDAQNQPIDESAFAATARTVRPPPPAAPRTWLERHPGTAVAAIAGAIAIAAWIAATLSAPTAPSHAGVPLPPLAIDARAMLARGEAAAAVKRLEDAVEQQPKDPALRVALAHAYLRSDRADAAVPHYLWAAKQAPKVFDAEHAADLGTLAASRKSAAERLELLRASERIGDPVDLIAAARATLDGGRCEDKKLVVKILRERAQTDALSLLEPLARGRGCGTVEAKKAVDALTADSAR